MNPSHQGAAGNSSQPTRYAIVALLVLLAGGACGGDAGLPTSNGEWESAMVTDGNVTTVRTLSGSVWGGSATFEEELAIGVESGDDPYMFGRVRAVATYDDEIYVLDQQVPAVRVYDSDGRHVRDIGRRGQGPGEFTNPRSMVIGGDGRVYVRDAENGRINIFSPQGDDLGVLSMPGGANTPQPMVMTDEGTLYNFQPVNMSDDFSSWRMGMVPMNIEPGGNAGSLEPPDFGFEARNLQARREGSVSISGVPFAPGLVWRLAPSGAMIAGVSDDYTFDIRYPDGRVTRIEKNWQPVAVEADEASWNRKTTIAGLQRTQPDWTWEGPDIPANKPAFDRFYPDRVGRVWVRRPGPGVRAEGECNDAPTAADPFGGEPCWTGTRTWEVFDLEGRFLGPADVPAGAERYTAPFITEREFLAAVADEQGTVMIKRYRIVLPEN